MRFAVVVLLFAPAPAFAHKLTVAVTPLADPPRLRVEAAYDDGTPADGATATVRDAAGVEVARGTLDASGIGELPAPTGEWIVTVDDGAGHRLRVTGATEAVTTAGPNRWAMVALGLALIGGWVGWRMRSRG